METIGWLLFVLPFVTMYGLMVSAQATADRGRYNPNEYTTVENGIGSGG